MRASASAACLQSGMAQRSPLFKGVPFLFLLCAGTYTLSLFAQLKLDFVVRSPCSVLQHHKVLSYF